jgi:hypothetical protein
LIPIGDYPEELKREKFPQTLLESVKIRPIIPTLSGQPVVAKSARIVPGADAEWLPAEVFGEVVPIKSADDLRFLKSLEVQPLAALEMKERLIARKT